MTPWWGRRRWRRIRRRRRRRRSRVSCKLREVEGEKEGMELVDIGEVMRAGVCRDDYYLNYDRPYNIEMPTILFDF